LKERVKDRSLSKTLFGRGYGPGGHGGGGGGGGGGVVDGYARLTLLPRRLIFMFFAVRKET